jgi:hypothetical protein
MVVRDKLQRIGDTIDEILLANGSHSDISMKGCSDYGSVSNQRQTVRMRARLHLGKQDSRY